MNTASRLLGMPKSPNWHMHYGKRGAVRKDRRRWTGSKPLKHCGPAQKVSKSKDGIKGRFGHSDAPRKQTERGTVPDPLTVTLETILVVDDNEAALKVVVEILKRAHFKVLSAADGAGAVELATRTEGRIDLLLSDVDMPLMSGP